MPRNYSYFDPDLDADEYGLGTFTTDDGRPFYDYDPELASSLPQGPQASIAPEPAPEPEVRAAEPAVAPTPVAQDAGAPDWTMAAQPQAGRAVRNNNPGNLMFAGQQGAERADDGFAQFPDAGTGMKALVRQVELDQGRGLSVSEFTAKYAPAGHGDNNPETYAADLAGALGGSPDDKLADYDPGEVAKRVAWIESHTTFDGQRPPQAGAVRAQEAPTPAGMGAPAGMSEPPAGMVPVQVQTDGSFRSPKEMAARTGELRGMAEGLKGSYDAAAQQNQATRVSGIQERLQAEQQRLAQAQQQQEVAQRARKDAEHEAAVLLAEPVQELDPHKYMRELSSGGRILTIVSLIAGALGQAAFAMAGIQTGNTGAEMLNRAIRDSIESQKLAIRQGRADKNNRVAHFQRLGKDAEQAERMADAEMTGAAARAAELEARKIEAEGGDATKAWQVHAQIDQEFQAKIQQEVETNESKNRITYARVAAQASAKEELAQAQLALAKRKLGKEEAQEFLATVAPGTEDQSQEARDQLAVMGTKIPEYRSHVAKVKKGMETTQRLENRIGKLVSLLGVQRDPRTGAIPRDTRVNSKVVGWVDQWLVNNNFRPAETLSDKDLEVFNTLVDIEQLQREGWVTEPNGMLKQEQLSRTWLPKADKNFGVAVNGLLERTQGYQKIILQSNPGIVAIWKNQANWPLAGEERYPAPAGRRVTGPTKRTAPASVDPGFYDPDAPGMSTAGP